MSKDTNNTADTQEVFFIKSEMANTAFENLRRALCNKFLTELNSWKHKWDNDEDSEKYYGLENIEDVDETNNNMLECSPSFNAFALSLLNNGYTAVSIEKEGVIENGLFKTGLERFLKEQSVKDPDGFCVRALNEIIEAGGYKEKEPTALYTVGDYMLDLYDMIEEDLITITDPNGPDYMEQYDAIDHDMIMLGILQSKHLAEYAQKTFRPEMTHEEVRASYVTSSPENENYMESIFAQSLNKTANDIKSMPRLFGNYDEIQVEKTSMALRLLTERDIKPFHEKRVKADIEATKKRQAETKKKLKDAIVELVSEELYRLTNNEKGTVSEDNKKEYKDINVADVLKKMSDGYLNKYTDIYFDEEYTAERLKKEGVRNNGVFANIVGEMAITFLVDNPKSENAPQYKALLTAALATGTLSEKDIEIMQRALITDRELKKAEKIKIAAKESINNIGDQMLEMKDAEKTFGSDTSAFTCMTNALRDLKAAHDQDASSEIKSALLELAYTKCAHYSATHKNPSTGYGQKRLAACKKAMEEMRSIDPQLDGKLKESVTENAVNMEIANILAEKEEQKNPRKFSTDEARLAYITKQYQSEKIKYVAAELNLLTGSLESLANKCVPVKERNSLTEKIADTMRSVAPAKSTTKKISQEDGLLQNLDEKSKFFEKITNNLKATQRRFDGSTQKFFDMVLSMEATTKCAQMLAKNPKNKKAQLQYSQSVMFTEKAIDNYLEHKMENNNGSERSETRISLAKEAKEYIAQYKEADKNASKTIADNTVNHKKAQSDNRKPNVTEKKAEKSMKLKP